MMTEQEAKAWAARLTRIWSQEEIVERSAQWVVEDAQFRFEADYRDDVSLYFQVGGTGMDNISLDRTKYDSELRELTYRGEMGCNNDTGRIVVGIGFESEREKHDFTQFADQWLPFFRRGCWLSGCPIEASAHEKVEWIQGFTREEIDAWNLKM